MFGLGMGLPYSVLFSVASEWFPKHRGLVVGIIAAGLGLGSLVFSPIQTALINPHNIHDLADPRVKDNLPRAFSILGGIMLALQVIGLCLCRERKKEIENEKRSDSTRLVSTSDLDESRDEEEQMEEMSNSTITQALRSAGFYIIFSIIFLDVIAVTIQSATFKVFGKDCHLDDWFLTTIATLSSAFNCIGRITWGFIIDKFSFKVPLNWMLVQWALLMATFPIIGEASYIKVLYAIWVFGLFFTMAGHFVLMPAACTSCFGPKNMATIYGLLYLATAPSSLLLSAIISQFNIEGEWDTVYWSCAAVLSLGFVLSLFLKDQTGACKTCSNICAPCCPSSSTEYSEIQIIDQDEKDKI
ncbi:unnamed protein product [Dibothriocephalus latus]|uniref:Major facilitator superfamily (MFS) profile domain-containing protein n=1 Tax=Dibothriocephalus latus TaxID=60516 RepID=A0A3P7LI47_DIBLA|nr:unnamed protein product [Dibothriocephalus latus]